MTDATMLARCASLQIKAHELEARQRDAAIVSQVNSARDELEDYGKELDCLLHTLRGLHGKGVLAKKPIDIYLGLETLRTLLGRIEEKLQDTPGDFRGGNRWGNLKTFVEGIIIRLRDELSRVWKEHVDDENPKIESFLPVLQLKLSPSKFGELKDRQRQIAQLGQRLPSAVDIDQLEKLCLHQRAAFNSQNLSNVPESVSRFLGLARDGSATLAELDDETLRWLKENNLLRSFKVRV